MPGQNVRIGSTTSSPKVGGPVDADGEVICPLLRPDGRVCSKKCTGERRFRSMQEHIRRAHPDDYLPRLAATKESFLKMVNSAKKRTVNGEQIFNHNPSSAGGSATFGTYGNNSIMRTSNGGTAQAPSGTIRATTPNATPNRSRKTNASTPTMTSSNNAYGSSGPGGGGGVNNGVVGGGTISSGGGHKRTKSGGWAGFRDEVRYEKRIEDMSPPSTSSDANDLPTINVSLAKMGGRPSMDDLFRAVDESMSDEYKSESGSDTPKNRGRKPKRRRSHYEDPYGDNLNVAAHKAKRSRSRGHITPRGTTGRVSGVSGSSEDDADRTLEMEDDQPVSEIDAIRRWDELVMAATSATGVEVASSASSSHVVTSSAPGPSSQPALTTVDITPPPQSVMGGNATPPSVSRDRIPSVSSSQNMNTSSRSITISYTPKVECSSCGRSSEMSDSYACPECISGVCKDCVVAMKKQDVQSCPCCSAVGVVFKVIRIVIR